MSRNLNLAAAVNYIHWAPPGDLDGLLQATTAKCKELKINPGRRTGPVTPKEVIGDPSVNVRSILDFIESVEPITEDDKAAASATVPDEDKGQPEDTGDVLLEKAERRRQKEHNQSAVKRANETKGEAINNLLKLHATLAARCAFAGHKVPEPEKPAEAPPLPAPTPDPKPLA